MIKQLNDYLLVIVYRCCAIHSIEIIKCFICYSFGLEVKLKLFNISMLQPVTYYRIINYKYHKWSHNLFVILTIFLAFSNLKFFVLTCLFPFSPRKRLYLKIFYPLIYLFTFSLIYLSL